MDEATGGVFVSLAEFISMSGYGKYVWSAYGFTLAVLALNFVFAARKFRNARRQPERPMEQDVDDEL